MTAYIRLAAGIATAASICTRAAALTFTLTTAPQTSLTADQQAAFLTAANAWSALLTDDITVNLQVGFTALGANILGATTLNYVSVGSGSLLSALTADRTSAADAQAVASLTALPQAPGGVLLTTAQARALGYPTTGIDATIEFSTAYTFATSRNADGGTPANAYDLIGVAEHEIAHALGFISGFDSGSQRTLLDAFRFTGAGVRAAATGAAYFSLDDGATSLASFSPGGIGNYQASHWLQGTGGLMDPAVPLGVTKPITALDIEALDVLGYDVAVPEPASMLVLLVGFAGTALARRPRTKPRPRDQAAAR